LLPRNRFLRHGSDPPPSAPDFATAYEKVLATGIERHHAVHIVGATFMGFYFDAAKEMQRGVSTGVLESEIRVFPTRNSYCSTVGPSCGCDSDCSHRPNPASVRSRAALSDSVLAVHFTDVISAEGMGNVVAEMPHIVPVGVVQRVRIAPTYKLS
jgi:hypothetical protein